MSERDQSYDVATAYDVATDSIHDILIAQAGDYVDDELRANLGQLIGADEMIKHIDGYHRINIDIANTSVDNMFARLYTALQQAKNIEVSGRKIYAEIEKFNTCLDRRVVEARLDRYRKQLKIGQIAVPKNSGEGETELLLIPVAHRQHFLQDLDAFEDQVRSDDQPCGSLCENEPSKEDIFLFLHSGVGPLMERIQRVKDHTLSRLELEQSMIQEIQDTSCTLHYTDARATIRDVLRELTGEAITQAAPQEVKKEFNKLIKMLEEYSHSPEECILDHCILEQSVETYTQNLFARIDRLITQRNVEIIDRLKLLPKEKKARPSSDQDQDTTIAKGGECAVADSSDQEEKVTRGDNEESVFSDAGIHDAIFSWINSSRPTRMQFEEFGTKEKSIYVVRAISPGLNEISELTREKMPHEIQRAIEQQAKAIVDGIMPFHKGSKSKLMLNQSNRNLGYEGITIWYTAKRRKNAERVYFTYVDSVGELLPDGFVPKLDINKKCLIILAETDKKNQVEVIQHLTGLGRRMIRKGNAGSI
jgi:hypothetical protein